jgi:hypothetical protein
MTTEAPAIAKPRTRSSSRKRTKAPPIAPRPDPETLPDDDLDDFLEGYDGRTRLELNHSEATALLAGLDLLLDHEAGRRLDPIDREILRCIREGLR